MRQRAIDYLVALRLSASVALTYLPWEPRHDESPIVRVMDTRANSGFDRREPVTTASGPGVVTLPIERATGSARSFFADN